MSINLSIEKYSKYKSWQEYFPDNKVDLTKFPYHSSWNEMFEKLFEDKRLANIQKVLFDELSEDSTVVIHPAPELVFNAFLLTPLDKVKVVFIGQDPYFNHEVYGDKKVHQAMGLSFSVPHGVKVPSSLDNIYKNLLKNGQMKKKPTHGNLDFWAIQGCLMLNSALTVTDGNPNAHELTWKWFTDEIIKYVSNNTKGVTFVLWGKNACDKQALINLDDNYHEVVISSHPSGRSANKTLGQYPAFDDLDHFGKINKYLVKNKKQEIVWRL